MIRRYRAGLPKTDRFFVFSEKRTMSAILNRMVSEIQKIADRYNNDSESFSDKKKVVFTLGNIQKQLESVTDYALNQIDYQIDRLEGEDLK